MFFKIFAAFTLIPAAEIYLLVKIGSHIGALNTIGLVILTALVGASLARLQGLITLQRVQRCLQRGELPAEHLVDALLIFVAGIVLLTPGFLTDLAGMLLLIPRCRNGVKRWLRRKFDAWVITHRYHGPPVDPW